MALSEPDRFSVYDFSKVFALRNKEGNPYVLIGGQAVNYWAETYCHVETRLQELVPFTSVDIDFKGTREDVQSIAEELGRKAFFPGTVEMTALAGTIPIKLGDLDSAIEVVRIVPGVSDAELMVVESELRGNRIRVMDPISVAASKLELSYLASQEKRQDLKQLKIAILCVRGFLRGTLEVIERGEADPAGWLGAVNRMRKLATSKHGRKAAKEHGVDWAFLPREEIAAAKNEKIVRFREMQLPRWGE